MAWDIFDVFRGENTDLTDEIMALFMFEEMMEDGERSEREEGQDAP